MATNFSPCKGSYVLNQFPSNVMFGMNGFHISASGVIQGHHGPLVKSHVFCLLQSLSDWTSLEFCHWSKGVKHRKMEKTVVNSINFSPCPMMF